MTGERSNDSSMPRRKFLKLSAATVGGFGAAPAAELESTAAEPGSDHIPTGSLDSPGERPFNSVYTSKYLDHVAFPLGGIGAGMVCLEGTGALSHVSLRNRPEIYNEPCVFAAISVKGQTQIARVLEWPVPTRKIFGPPGTRNVAGGTTYGLPRFTS